MTIERISIEVTNRCAKACWFCYSHSLPDGPTNWSADELVEFVADCASHGIKAVSFGGGEPLQFDGMFDVLDRLRGRLFRSMTSNGLLLSEPMLDRLVDVAPDKVHLSIHFPEKQTEVERVIRQVHRLAERGIRSGINLLVARSNLAAAARAASQVRDAGISNDRIGVSYENRKRQLRTGGDIWAYYWANIGMLLRSTHLVQQLGVPFEAGEAFVAPEGPVTPVYALQLSAATYKAIHDADQCLGCVDLGNAVGSNPERLGLYIYSAWDHHPYGPYVKEMAPRIPLQALQLPSDMFNRIARAELNSLRFADAKYVQPIEHIPCRVYGRPSPGEEYLASDLVSLRPLPPATHGLSNR